MNEQRVGETQRRIDGTQRDVKTYRQTDGELEKEKDRYFSCIITNLLFSVQQDIQKTGQRDREIDGQTKRQWNIEMESIEETERPKHPEREGEKESEKEA